ncbi:reverse transcriptase domain-containing protein [Tanacetum coccineum]
MGVANSGVANSGVANSGVANSAVANSGVANSGVANSGIANSATTEIANSDIANSDIANSATTKIANSDIANSGTTEIANSGIANSATTEIANSDIANSATTEIANSGIANLGPVWGCDRLVSKPGYREPGRILGLVYNQYVMAALFISISSNLSVESVGSFISRVILIGSISVEVAPEVGAAAVASPAGVLELDTYSSLEADLSDSSLPPVSVASMVSPFLCSNDSESDTEMPERHVSPTPHDAMCEKLEGGLNSLPLFNLMYNLFIKT